MMPRTENYGVVLTQYAESIRDKPFKWGETDCGTIAREVLRIVYGLEPKISTYKSQRKAIKTYEAEIGSYLTYFNSLGFEPVAPMLANNGSVIVVEDKIDRFGVIVSGHILTSEIDGKVTMYPLDRKNISGVVLR